MSREKFTAERSLVVVQAQEKLGVMVVKAKRIRSNQPANVLNVFLGWTRSQTALRMQVRQNVNVTTTISPITKTLCFNMKRSSLLFPARCHRRRRGTSSSLTHGLNRSTFASFEKVYVDLAAQYKIARIPFLLDGVGGVPRLMQRDGIHPTGQGNAIVAKTVYRYLKPMLE